MKTTFLKSRYWLINQFSMILIVQIFWVLAYLYLSSVEQLDTKFTFVFFFLLLINSFFTALPILVGQKTYLSKFTITDNGIIWSLHKKKILCFDWEDILDASIETRQYRKCLVFEITKQVPEFRKNEFFFNVDKENIEVLHAFCKNDRIKTKIRQFIEKKEYVTPIFLWQKK